MFDVAHFVTRRFPNHLSDCDVGFQKTNDIDPAVTPDAVLECGFQDHRVPSLEGRSPAPPEARRVRSENRYEGYVRIHYRSQSRSITPIPRVLPSRCQSHDSGFIC